MTKEIDLNSWLILLIAITGFLTWFFLFYRNLRAKATRSRQMARIAMRLGFTFYETGDKLKTETFLHLPAFNKNTTLVVSSGRFTNLMEGSFDEVRILIFDYLFLEGLQNIEVEKCQTFIVLRIKNKKIPIFTLHPRGLIPESVLSFGKPFSDLKVIKVESHPEFSRWYTLRSNDEEAMRSLFSTDVFHLLTQNPKFIVEGGGEWLVVSQKNCGLIAPDEISSFLNTAKMLFKMLNT